MLPCRPGSSTDVMWHLHLLRQWIRVVTGLFFVLRLDASPLPGAMSLQRTVNTDAAFKKWSRTNVPFYLDSNYTSRETDLIHRAIIKLSQDLKQCVTFHEVNPADTVFKVKITPLQAAPNQDQEEGLCYSYPGHDVALEKTGAREQRLSVTRGSNGGHGCLPADGKLRGVMKVLTVLLGKRNEHQRGDRDDYITLHPNDIMFEGAYRKYTASEAYWAAFPYDYSSITHNSPTDFSIPGKTAFAVKRPPYTIPTNDRLSVYDCKLISMMYGCDPARCVSPRPLTTVPLPAAMQHIANTAESAHDLPHWGYQIHISTDEVAPADWSVLSTHCSAARQSPITIDNTTMTVRTDLRQLNMANYNELPIGEKWTVVNNGHSVQFTAVFEDIPRLQGGSLGAAYDFQQFHFHWGSDDSRGSEHVIDKKTFPIELHIVHRKVNESDDNAMQDATGLSVLGIVFRVATAEEEEPDYSHHIDNMVAAIKRVQTPLKPITVVIPEFDLDDLIPDIVQYFRYNGSLTTPPCAEVVQWSVLKDPLLITEDQLNVFRSLRKKDGAALEDNFRPMQSHNQRPVVLYPG